MRNSKYYLSLSCGLFIAMLGAFVAPGTAPAQRRSPASGTVYEAEALAQSGKILVSGGNVVPQPMSGFGQGWSGNSQLLWTGGQPGAVLDLMLDVPVEGLYVVELHMTRAPDFGQLRIQVNGENVPAVFDGYSPTVVPSGPVQVGSFNLGAGARNVSFMIEGKNSKATGFLAGIDFIKLSRLEPVQREGKLASGGPAQGYEITVDRPRQSMSFTGYIPGEAQSTVVPPGLKSQCQAGRFIVTNDAHRPTEGGSVVWRDLDSAGTTFTQTSFDSIPLDTSKIAFKTNDHDIITMSNGDLVLIWGMHFATPLSQKPGWFDITFKGSFGPGVRRGVMVWRSSDCGQSFKYAGQVDPAATADGSCAFPQWSKDSTGNFIKTPPYANGGVDGQLIKLDPSTNKIYLMFQCVGQKQDSTKTRFTLTSERLNKTMVLMSPDEGTTWNMLGWLNTATWRYGVVPMSQGGLAFAASNILSFGTKLGNGTYKFDVSGTPTPTGKWGWDDFDVAGVKTLVGANIFAHTIATRVPEDRNGIMLTFPGSVEQNGTIAHGYRVFFYDRTKNQYAEADPIVPVPRNPGSFTMHLTAVDLGVGPILLYWYNINLATKKGTIRGRLVTGPGEYSDDFAIFGASSRGLSRTSPLWMAESFDLGTAPYWYGDYKTAGGYAEVIRRRLVVPGEQPQTYHYFPMWIEPDKTVRHVRVSVEAVASQTSIGTIKISPRTMTWRPAPSTVELKRRRLTPAEVRDIVEYGQRAIAP